MDVRLHLAAVNAESYLLVETKRAVATVMRARDRQLDDKEWVAIRDGFEKGAQKVTEWRHVARDSVARLIGPSDAGNG